MDSLEVFFEQVNEVSRSLANPVREHDVESIKRVLLGQWKEHVIKAAQTAKMLQDRAERAEKDLDIKDRVLHEANKRLEMFESTTEQIRALVTTLEPARVA
jgi:uncharacterized protein related to proFAR isomerase